VVFTVNVKILANAEIYTLFVKLFRFYMIQFYPYSGVFPYLLIFADAWPGKYDHLDEALQLLNIGGYYLIDDLLPQPNWPAQHQINVDRLIENLTNRTDFVYTTFNWSTGLILFTRIR